ncbi:hypothetical protein N9059_00690 [bacterium]|nr:hypothetical protein [bacterium]
MQSTKAAGTPTQIDTLLHSDEVNISQAISLLEARKDKTQISKPITQYLLRFGKYIQPLIPYLEATCDTNSVNFLSLRIAASPETIPPSFIDNMLRESGFKDSYLDLVRTIPFTRLAITPGQIETAFQNLDSTNGAFGTFCFSITTFAIERQPDLNGYWSKVENRTNRRPWVYIALQCYHGETYFDFESLLLDLLKTSNPASKKGIEQLLGLIKSLDKSTMEDLWKGFPNYDSHIQLYVAAALIKHDPTTYSPQLSEWIHEQTSYHLESLKNPESPEYGAAKHILFPLSLRTLGNLKSNNAENFDFLKEQHTIHHIYGAIYGLRNLAGHYRPAFDWIIMNDDRGSLIDPKYMDELQVLELIQIYLKKNWEDNRDIEKQLIKCIAALPIEQQKKFQEVLLNTPHDEDTEKFSSSLYEDNFRYRLLFHQGYDKEKLARLLITKLRHRGTDGFIKEDLPIFELLKPHAEEVMETLLLETQDLRFNNQARAHEIIELIDPEGTVKAKAEAELLSYEVPAY